MQIRTEDSKLLTTLKFRILKKDFPIKIIDDCRFNLHLFNLNSLKFELKLFSFSSLNNHLQKNDSLKTFDEMRYNQKSLSLFLKK